MENETKNEGILTQSMKRLIIWGGMIAAGLIGLSYVVFIIYWTWNEGWVKEVITEHFAATIGLPLSAIGAFLLVTVLQISAGKIEFEALGFKFRGASGPAVLWVLCFLAIATAINCVMSPHGSCLREWMRDWCPDEQKRPRFRCLLSPL